MNRRGSLAGTALPLSASAGPRAAGYQSQLPPQANEKLCLVLDWSG